MNGRVGANTAALESQLADIWRRLHRAAMEADRCGRSSVGTDLEDICDEVRRVQESLLRAGSKLRTRPRDPQQLRVSQSSRLPF